MLRVSYLSQLSVPMCVVLHVCGPIDCGQFQINIFLTREMLVL